MSWSSCQAPTKEFNRAHVFGSPVYVLDARLQDGHRIPKWSPKARLGIFLGSSTLHSSLVPLVMNVAMGKISPQYHVIFDKKFETVISLEEGLLLEKEWEYILCLKQECYKEVDYDDNSQQLLPPLASILADQQQALHEDYNEYIPMTLDQQTPQERPELNEFEMHQNEEIPLPEGALQEKAATSSTLPEPNLASTENAVPEGDMSLHGNLNASTRPR
jgi:hypothetical protein